jgi:hypothetical protein
MKKKEKTLIPTIGAAGLSPGQAQEPLQSRKREKECAGASCLHPLPLAGEGRVRVFFL